MPFIERSPTLVLAAYLLLSAAGLLFSIPVPSLTFLFEILNGFVLVGTGYWLVLNHRRIRESLALAVFFVFLFAFFSLRGAYLEFPSDPWEHFRRIFEWQNVLYLRESAQWNKFSYFWAWSWLSRLPIEQRRFGLDLYGAFWQTLLSVQFYRLARSLNFSKPLAIAQTLGIWLFFGHNVFNFRYYALSSTMPAYCAYLELLRIGITHRLEPVKTLLRKLPWVSIWVCLLLILFNHHQELLLLLVSLLALLLNRLYVKGKIKTAHVIVLVGVTLISYWIIFRLFSHTATVHQMIRLYYPSGHRNPFPGFLTRIGVFKLWGVRGHYFETFALPGAVGVLLAAARFRSHSCLSSLTLLPIGLCLFPPFVLALTHSTDVANTYRVLYAFPLSFVLVASLSEFLTFLGHRWFGGASQKAVAAASLLVLAPFAMVPEPFWRGRLWFELFQPSPMSELRPLDATAQWFKSHLNPLPGCSILSDNPTGFLLATQLGIPSSVYRNVPSSRFQQEDWIQTIPPSCCLVLVPLKANLPSPTPSPVAKLSGHWRDSNASVFHQMPSETSANLDLSLGNDWLKLPVPPFYVLYQRKKCDAACQPGDPLYKPSR